MILSITVMTNYGFVLYRACRLIVTERSDYPDYKIKTPHASSRILEIYIINNLPASDKFCQINWKTAPCLITKTKYLPYFVVSFRINASLPNGFVLPSLTQIQCFSFACLILMPIIDTLLCAGAILNSKKNLKLNVEHIV